MDRLPCMSTDTATGSRLPLSRPRVLHQAVEIADREGIGALTMRHLASQLGVEAMSLYYHVANKETMLGGVVDVVVDEIIESVEATDRPDPSTDWRGSVRARILAARQVLVRHPWAPALIESRTEMSLPAARYYDALVGELRAGGFSYDLSHHALHALGSRALGFTQELWDPAGGEDDGSADAMMQEMMGELPHLVGMLGEISHDDPDSTLGWCDDQFEFEFGLDLLLEGLERHRTASWSPR